MFKHSFRKIFIFSSIAVLSFGLVAAIILSSQKQDPRSKAAENTSNLILPKETPFPSPSPATIKETVYDYDSRIIYEGSWGKYEPGPFNLNFHYTSDQNKPDGSITFSFTGNRLDYYFSKYPQGGIVEILIDGVRRHEIDLYDADFRWNMSTYVDLYNQLPHKLTIRNTGRKNPASSGYSFNLHKLVTTRTIKPVPQGTYDDIDVNITYTGSWTPFSSSGPYKDTLRYSNDPNASISIYFQGTGISYIYSKAFNRGIYEVYIDDKKVEEIDAYAPNIIWQQKKVYSGLSNQPHTIKIKNTDRKNISSTGNYIDLDGFEVTENPQTITPTWFTITLPPNTTPIETTDIPDKITPTLFVSSPTPVQPPDKLSPTPFVGKIVDDFDSGIIYQNTWSQIQSTQFNFFQNTVHYTNVAGNSASFSFIGNQINYIYTKYPNRGIAIVYIDGIKQQEIDLYAPNIVSQSKTIFTNFSQTKTMVPDNTIHTIKVVNSGNKNPASSDTYIDIDGFEVAGKAPNLTPRPTMQPL